MLLSSLNKTPHRAEDCFSPGSTMMSLMSFFFLLFFKYLNPSLLTLVAFPHRCDSKKRRWICDFHLKLIHAFTALLQFLNTVRSPLWHRHNPFWAPEILLFFLVCFRISLPQFLLPLRRTQEYRLRNALIFFGTMLEGPPCPLPSSNIFMEINPCCPSPGQNRALCTKRSTLISGMRRHAAGLVSCDPIWSEGQPCVHRAVWCSGLFYR